MKRVKVIVVVVLFLSFGCKQENVAPDGKQNLRPVTATENKIIRANNDLAFKIFNNVNKSNPDQNIFISPLSISMALGMTYFGASDVTRDQLMEKLGYEFLNKNEINKAFFELSQLLKNIDDQVVLNMANGFWYHDALQVENYFRDILAAYYNAHIEYIDFYKNGVSDKINNWVAEKTNYKIKGIVDQVHPEDLIYLVNAIYYKAEWAYPFETSPSEPQNFYTRERGEVACEMMYTSQAKYLLYQDDEKAVIDLPYGNKQFSMTILMPHNNTSLHNIGNELSFNKLNQYLQWADTTGRSLQLPKFNISSRIQLKEVLSSMGMNAPFQKGANFSEVFQNFSHTNISDIIHKAEIEVNEESTEATTYTGQPLQSSSSKETLSINRPFIFFIREKHSGIILFAGKFIDPVV